MCYTDNGDIMVKGIGCDILSINRIKNIVETTPAFLKRIYSKAELEEYHHRGDDVSYLASRFAAKEAIVKALSKYEHDLNSVEILNDDNGKPYVVIQNQNRSDILISISYETEYVIAYVVLSSIL